MMHPKRIGNLEYLKERLGDVPVSMDTDENIWHTCRAAWEMHDPNAEFHLVVQDDAIICDDFLNRAESVLTEGAHSFYFGYRKNYVEQVAAALPTGEIVLPYLHWGLAVCLPTAHIRPIIRWGNGCDLPPHHDDTRIKTYLRSRGMTIRYPLPSLIDHKADVSLVTGEVNPKRCAIYYIDRKDV